jgi:hypothetical protein
MNAKHFQSPERAVLNFTTPNIPFDVIFLWVIHDAGANVAALSGLSFGLHFNLGLSSRARVFPPFQGYVLACHFNLGLPPQARVLTLFQSCLKPDS